jgi:CspA family cold shock protein
MILSGRVAWFDLKKQFGFVKVAGHRDVFLHMSVLKEAGYTFLPAGTTLRFTVDRSNGKPRVAEIHTVDPDTAEAGQPPAVRRKNKGSGSEDDSSPAPSP